MVNSESLIEGDLGSFWSIGGIPVECTVTSVLYVSVSFRHFYECITAVADGSGGGLPFFLMVDGNRSISCGISALTSLSTRINSPARDRSWFSPVKNVTAFPVFPARPVRPHRCTKSSISSQPSSYFIGIQRKVG